MSILTLGVLLLTLCSSSYAELYHDEVTAQYVAAPLGVAGTLFEFTNKLLGFLRIMGIISFTFLLDR